MSNVSKYNYEKIDIPYDNYLNRQGNVLDVGLDNLEYQDRDLNQTSNSSNGYQVKGIDKIEGNNLDNLWINSWIKSRNYKPKAQGFYINGAEGYIECMKLFVGSGGIVGGSLDIPNTTTSDSFHVDATGNTWWGANVADYTANNDNAPAWIKNDGSAKFQDITIDSGELISSTITGGTLQTDTTGARVVITGNDLYCYDDTTGGGGSITGNVASIYFPRTDDASMRFVMQKRASKNNDDGNVMELFYDEPAPGSGYNYLFIGNPGDSTNWYTDVTSLDGSDGIALATAAQNIGGGGGEEFLIFTRDYPGLAYSFELGASRVVLAANQSSTGSAWNPATGAGGGALLFGLYSAAGFDLYHWIDSDGIWIANGTIKSYTDGSSHLGDGNHGFGNLYIDTITASTGSSITVDDDLDLGGHNISASSGDFSASIDAGSIFPQTGGNYQIGNATLYWDAMYVDKVYVDEFYARTGSAFAVSDDFVPDSNGSLDLGGSSNYWANVYSRVYYIRYSNAYLEAAGSSSDENVYLSRPLRILAYDYEGGTTGGPESDASNNYEGCMYFRTNYDAGNEDNLRIYVGGQWRSVSTT